MTSPLGLFTEYASLRSRVFPLLVDTPIFKRDSVSLILPEGFTVGETPKTMESESEFGRYRLGTIHADRTLEIRREAQIPPQRVETDAYEDFRNFTRAIDEAEQQEILIETR